MGMGDIRMDGMKVSVRVIKGPIRRHQNNPERRDGWESDNGQGLGRGHPNMR